MSAILRGINKFNDILANRIELSGNPVVLFGICFVINYIIEPFYALWYYKKFYDPYLLSEIICFIAAWILVLNKYLPSKIRRYLPLYYYMCVLYMLPIVSSYAFFSQKEASLELINVLQNLFVLILIFDWLSFFIVTVVGAIIGILAVKLIYNYIPLHVVDKSPVLFSILWTMFVGLFFSRKISQHRQTRRLREQLEAMKTGGFIAHEVRTPLSTIQMSMLCMQQDLPELIKAYEFAHQQDPAHFKKSPEQFSMLSTLVNNVQSATRSASNIIDILLVKVNQESKIDASTYQTVNIKTVVSEAIARYPFQAEERNIVHWDANANPDFTFHGEELLTIHILFNLFRNALFHMKAANKGEIFISTKTDTDFNYLMVKDTGPGIPKESLPKIFERSFTTSSKGIGLGLNFCRTVMESYHGKISCDSVFGEFTEFTLKFPAQ